MIIQLVKVRSALPDAEIQRRMEERAPLFRAVPGLLQKYFCREPETGNYAGVYLWDSEESLRRFRQSDLARSTRVAYQLEEEPRIEILEVLFPSRAGELAAMWAQAEMGS